MFGGVLLGFIVASCVFIYRWQKTKKELEKKDNVSQNCNQNSAYESEDYDQSDTMNKTPKTTKISQVNPIPRQQNTFTSHSTEDGVYNHLNESATSTTKTDDVYDHARLHSSTSVHCEGYGTLVFDHEGNEIYMKGDGKGAGCNVEKEIKNEHTAHNYFILEKETI
ncbi:uncharacterized protein LOC134281797 [Saccostrea cucullata]|uniref:uncharacterized protein LOC134281797 n=1 Tax=Saccostrea cuccullata TaxID=36930 RepID=UPI002ED57D97